MPNWNLTRVFARAGSWAENVAEEAPQTQGESGIGALTVHPKFVHSNATSHSWLFGALAEVVDNSIDSGATRVQVDVGEVSLFCDDERRKEPSIEVTDNGPGMDAFTLQQCLGLGKSSGKGAGDIGGYGNGLKSGAMRLGAVTLVFSQDRKTGVFTAGLFSYLYNVRVSPNAAMIPRLTWDRDLHPLGSDQDFNQALNVIKQWGPYEDLTGLWKQLVALRDQGGGTKVVISHLWHAEGRGGTLELDLNSDAHDIWLPEAMVGVRHMRSLMEGEAKIREMGESRATYKYWKTKKSSTEAGQIFFDMGVLRANAYRFSLREYLKILYLPSRFEGKRWDGIYLRGHKVAQTAIISRMQHREEYTYQPKRRAGDTAVEPVTFYLGFMRESPSTNQDGICIYRRGRLVLPYLNVYKNNWSHGRGVIGVVNQEHIFWTHNKQELEKSEALINLQEAIKKRIKEYWGDHASKVGYKAERHDRRKGKKRMAAADADDDDDDDDEGSPPAASKSSAKKKAPVSPRAKRGNRAKAAAVEDPADEPTSESDDGGIGRTRPQRTNNRTNRVLLDAALESSDEDEPLLVRRERAQQQRKAPAPAPNKASAPAAGEMAALRAQLQSEQAARNELQARYDVLMGDVLSSNKKAEKMQRRFGAARDSLNKLKKGVSEYCKDPDFSTDKLLDLANSCTEDGFLLAPKSEPDYVQEAPGASQHVLKLEPEYRYEARQASPPALDWERDAGHHDGYPHRRDNHQDRRGHDYDHRGSHRGSDHNYSRRVHLGPNHSDRDRQARDGWDYRPKYSSNGHQHAQSYNNHRRERTVGNGSRAWGRTVAYDG